MPPMECPQSSATCGAQPSRAKRGPAARSAAAAEGGRRRKAPGSRRRPPSFARASNKSTDASLLAATELVASKQPWSAGKRALHERVYLCFLMLSCKNTKNIKNMTSVLCLGRDMLRAKSMDSNEHLRKLRSYIYLLLPNLIPI